MKVTVSFGHVRVVVPCGNGQLLIADLMNEAKARYRKALGKTHDHWIAVHTLKSSDGGILDPDDHVAEVTDDREQIVAEFTEGMCPNRFQNGASGVRAISAEAESPRAFLSSKDGVAWNTGTSSGMSSLQMTSCLAKLKETKVGYEEAEVFLGFQEPEKTAASESFARQTSARKSVIHTTMQWIESQEGMELEKVEEVNRMSKDAEKADNEDESPSAVDRNVELSKEKNQNQEPLYCKPTKFLPLASTRMLGRRMEIDLLKCSGGLGFSVTTRDNFASGDSPIYIKSILPRGAAIKDGRLRPGDRLLEVNGMNMSGKLQDEVASTLRSISPGRKVHMVISRQGGSPSAEMGDETSGRSLLEKTTTTEETGVKKRNQTEDEVPAEELEEQVEMETGNQNSGQITDDLSVSCDSHVVKEIPTRDEGQGKVEATCDGGKRGKVERLSFLLSRTEKPGLGVCIEERTAEVGLFIKSITPGGTAAMDGRLRIGDRLICVNGSSIMSCSNAEAMATLQNEVKKTKDRSLKLGILRNRRASLAKEQFGTSENDQLSPSQSHLGISHKTPVCEKLNSVNALNKMSDVEVSQLTERSQPILIESFVQLPETVPTSSRCIGVADDQQTQTQHFSSSLNSLNSSHITNTISEEVQDRKSRVHREISCDDLPSENRLLKADGDCNFSPFKGDSELSPPGVFSRDGVFSPPGVFSRDGVGRQSMSEKRKACLDPSSFVIYQQIRAGKQHSNHCDVLRRALSIESILSQKATHDTASPFLTMTSEPAKHFGYLESLHERKPNSLGKTFNISQSDWHLQQHSKYLKFRDAMGYCYDGQQVTGDTNSESSGRGQDTSGYDTSAEVTTKNKVLRGLSSVFRLGKVKGKNRHQKKANKAQAQQLKDEGQRFNILLPGSFPKERLLQTAGIPRKSSNSRVVDGKNLESGKPARGEKPLAAESNEPSGFSAEAFNRSSEICSCQIPKKQLPICRCAQGLDTRRETQNFDHRESQEGQCNSSLPNLAAHQDTHLRKQQPYPSVSTNTSQIYFPKNKSHLRNWQPDEIKGKNPTLDPVSLRLPCCNSSEDARVCPEGTYRKLESAEQNPEWKNIHQTHGETFPCHRYDVHGRSPDLRGHLDRSLKTNNSVALDTSGCRLTATNSAQV